MSDVLTEDELTALEELERAATPVEWRVDDPDGDRDWIATVPENQRATFGRLWQFSLPDTSSPTGRLYADCPSKNEHDALLLVALRNAAPCLLAEVRRLRVELANLQQPKPRVTAAMVKEVRACASTGLLHAKACLEATGGDVEKAVELARRGGGG